jgi:hypothetical protein
MKRRTALRPRRPLTAALIAGSLLSLLHAVPGTDSPRTVPAAETASTANTVTDGTLSVAAPGKGNLRVYVLNGTGKIGADGPYLK